MGYTGYFYLSCVMCHVSCVMCHVLYVIGYGQCVNCHVPHVKISIKIYLFLICCISEGDLPVAIDLLTISLIVWLERGLIEYRDLLGLAYVTYNAITNA